MTQMNMNLIISIVQISKTNWIDIISTYLDSWLYYKLWKSLFWWVFVWFDSFLALAKKGVECPVHGIFICCHCCINGKSDLAWILWMFLIQIVLLPSLVHNKIISCFSSNLFLNISLYVLGMINPLSQRPYLVSFVIPSRYKHKLFTNKWG